MFSAFARGLGSTITSPGVEPRQKRSKIAFAAENSLARYDRTVTRAAGISQLLRSGKKGAENSSSRNFHGVSEMTGPWTRRNDHRLPDNPSGTKGGERWRLNQARSCAEHAVISRH